MLIDRRPTKVTKLHVNVDSNQTYGTKELIRIGLIVQISLAKIIKKKQIYSNNKR